MCLNGIRGQEGFSLMELLIAVTLLAIGLLALASMQTSAIGSNALANKHTVMNSLAQGVMEDIMAWKKNNGSLNVAVADVLYDLDPNSSETMLTLPGGGVYEARFSITPNASINGAVSPGMTEIQVTVRDTKSMRSATLTSFRAFDSTFDPFQSF